MFTIGNLKTDEDFSARLRDKTPLTGTPDIAVVVIGRNEGARLVASLASLQGVVSRVAYVDSGSTDDSLQAARDADALVVELDLSIPFTAARARNAGFAALDPVPEFVQFIDGDCVLEDGWISAGLAALDQNEDMGIVTGWRSEIHPNSSIYNGLADFEWHKPAGDINVCGGDMIARSKTFLAVNGFNPGIIAGEDEEFCIRVGKAGWRIHRLPLKMTRHDADMMRFDQWWQRAVRAGHANAQVSNLHPEYAAWARLRILVYGAVLPIAAVFALLLAPWLLVAVILLYVISYVRTVRGLLAAGLSQRKALHQSIFLSLSKLPNLLGMLTYYWRRLFHREMVLIEYK
jgi:GT2 family glycosyltransferase